ncbi:Mannosyl-oligosaccharide 1,2-alpha-mannosidase IA [Striga asiatica]|uniref:alpha-1,2-Mannosidase n=1 Tax=Striga asiatica TaxID=4170 RepID=A0A5A7NYT4_STRAF|nr:Mannosyl-oligosaccharide 1,2-alpha-mannosidase IA [Striga asiatica]
MGAPKKPLMLILIIFFDIFVCENVAEGVTREEAEQLRDEVREMFYHAFDGYMEHAFPHDELKPLSCGGEDTLGGYALTLIDSLDTLALLGDQERFSTSVEWIGKSLRFDINKTVSVFETTIRILGGLLSAHLIASDYKTGMNVPSYDDELLNLAEDLARRMLPAFDTPTGIPFGSVNLMHGVDENESKANPLWILFTILTYYIFPISITSTAGGGTLTLEFGVLSRLINDPIFEQVTKNAVRGLWARRSRINLLGAHIDVFSGEWTQKDAGIGTSIDSFYEYLLKAYILFGDEEYLFIFHEAYRAAMLYLFNDPWYVEVNMNSAALVWPLFNSLQAFWPGLQQGQKSYPLRPELIESTYWLYKATRNPSLQLARCTCGYCHISDVEFHQHEDHMESFFLAETVKYLWLLFDLAAGPDNLVETGPYKYIFSTEGHLLPATPPIYLASGNFSYLGAYCKSRYPGQEICTSDNINVYGFKNNTESFTDANNYFVHPSFQNSAASRLFKGFLTQGQINGLSYVILDHNPVLELPSGPTKDDDVANNSPDLLVSNQSSENSPLTDVDHDPQDNHRAPLLLEITTPEIYILDNELPSSRTEDDGVVVNSPDLVVSNNSPENYLPQTDVEHYSQDNYGAPLLEIRTPEVFVNDNELQSGSTEDDDVVDNSTDLVVLNQSLEDSLLTDVDSHPQDNHRAPILEIRTLVNDTNEKAEVTES